VLPQAFGAEDLEVVQHPAARAGETAGPGTAPSTQEENP
jgi:hypothetical protein